MKVKISQNSTGIAQSYREAYRETWLCFARGLAPLAFILVVGTLAGGLIALVRLLVDPISNFVVQQTLFAIILGAGLILAPVSSIRLIKHTVREIEMARRQGQGLKVRAGQLALTIVAMVFIFPVILIIVFRVGV